MSNSHGPVNTNKKFSHIKLLKLFLQIHQRMVRALNARHLFCLIVEGNHYNHYVGRCLFL